MAYQETADAHHEPHHVHYKLIFFALCVCTVISVALDIIPLNRRLVAFAVLAVAVAKAQYVMRYFMHLKFEGAWKYVLLLPTAILAVGLPLALAPDIGLHYYTPDVPQVRAAAQAEASHAEGTHDAGEAESHGGEAH
ncbi:MAG: cytochrome C oxidase subunit IV family protein [Planctomycetaceae bacterium]|nr:cytochrome C oxidase subunit IV family protein [Planctomycetaceae bacterium]